MGDSQQCVAVERYEGLLWLPRIAVGGGVAVLAWMTDSLSPPALAATGALLAALAGFVAITQSRPGLSGQASRRLAELALATDVVAAAAVFALLAASPDSPAVVLFPLLAFEVSLKWGTKGVVVSVAALVAAVAGRLLLRSVALGLGPRPVALMVVFFATVMLVGLALALRSRDERRSKAEAEGRLAAASALSDLVQQLLSGPGEGENRFAEDEVAQLRSLAEKAAESAEARAALARQCAEVLASLRPDPGFSAILTPREREILELLRQGMSDRKVASVLHLSAGTVRVHISNAMRKLAVTDRSAAIAAVAQPNRVPGGGAQPGSAVANNL